MEKDGHARRRLRSCIVACSRSLEVTRGRAIGGIPGPGPFHVVGGHKDYVPSYPYLFTFFDGCFCLSYSLLAFYCGYLFPHLSQE